jgi:hypothetical protein
MVFSEPSWRIVNYIWLVRIKEPPCGICEPGSEADPPVSSVPHCTGIALIDIIREVQTLGNSLSKNLDSGSVYGVHMIPREK